ncbi:MAG: FKBP-type peptidyl-prolyl cis-trans isomerase [Brumimicrobium sp.]
MKTLICILIFALVFIACESEAPKKEKKNSWSQEQSTKLNEQFTKEEEIAIKLYLKRRPEWDMKSTGSGLRYWVYEDQPGETAKEDDQVDVNFEVRMLDDSLLYSTADGNVSTFKVDKSNVETGVQEGIKYLSEGDKAKFIIPSHLAHGLLGDFNKIPPLQVLVVDIELLKIY